MFNKLKNIKNGDKVWVHQIDGTNTDGWVCGILIKKTKKTLKKASFGSPFFD